MVDIIIPHSNLDKYRVRNLFFIVKYYKEFLPDSNIIIVEQNTETDITEINDLVKSHIKLKIDKELFHKSYILNEAFNRQGYSIDNKRYIIFADTDCVMKKNILLNFNSLLPVLDEKVILPYNGSVINLNENQTVNLIENYNTFDYDSPDLVYRNSLSNGGIVMISSINYHKLGGYDPRFVGWGGEDDAFYLKANNILGIFRFDEELLHMNHSRNSEKMNNDLGVGRFYDVLLNMNKSKKIEDNNILYGNNLKYYHEYLMLYGENVIKINWMLTNGNWGDTINYNLLKKISNKKIIKINYNEHPKIPRYYCAGSVLGYNKTEFDEYWGSGFMFADGKMEIKPKKIHAVRGRLSREILLKEGIECPEVYGDPALLYPRFYKPNVEKKYKYGIIPHYVDKLAPWVLKMEKRGDVKIIDVLDNTINRFVDDVNSCEIILSSSLHGIICGDSYEIPSYWIKLSDKVLGDGFKFLDYFSSVKRIDTNPIIPDINDNPDKFNYRDYKINIDLDKLYDSCPFK